MTRDAAQAYADLILANVNLQPGQNLLVKSEPVAWDFLNVLAARAYDHGARFVQVAAPHALLHRVRVEHSRPEHLPYVPGARAATNQYRLDEGWALVTLVSPEDPDALAGIDPTRNGEVRKALAEADYPYRSRVLADELRWIVAALPTPRWAAKVLGKDASPATTDELWNVMVPILRLDRPDPAAAWRSQSETLSSRRRALDDLSLDALRFSGPGTDLLVGLCERSIWVGGGADAADGRRFIPNLPTEEVFTTPDFRRTDGRVAVTRPVQVLGTIVDGAWLEFSGGRVVACGARTGGEMLERYLEIDEGARSLGELALVDCESPIYRSGLVFYNTLFDENAASHIALGSSYAIGLDGGSDLSRDAYRDAGGNHSTVHTDLMIGSPEVGVTGLRRAGGEVPIIADGLFVV